jgi:hypothetical protein
MPKRYSEDELQQALAAVATGSSIHQAASDWAIPRSTLRNRFKGHQPRNEASESQQRLSPVQEERLVSWILIQEQLGLGVTHSQIRDFATRIVQTQGDQQPIGKRWIHGFFKRNPSLKTKKSRKIDAVRITAEFTDHLLYPRIFHISGLMEHPTTLCIPRCINITEHEISQDMASQNITYLRTCRMKRLKTLSGNPSSQVGNTHYN